MGKISCFSALLGGKRKTSKVKNKAAYAKKPNGNDCPKVKPVEFIDMAGTVEVRKGGGDPPACDAKVVVHVPAELARHGRDENGDEACIKSRSSDADLVPGEDSSGYNSDGTGKNAMDSEPRPSGSCVCRTSPRLKRSCSNIETARSVPQEFDLPAKSRSYDDLKTLPSGRLNTPSGAPDASPTASVKTSFSADRVMLKKRSSRQVLPSRSRKLWWRLFMWSHRSLHRPGASATMPTRLPPADAGGAPHQHDGYTSDTLDAVTVATAGATDKEAAAGAEPPIPNRWVAFSAEASSLDRVRAWVQSLGSGSFHAVDEVTVTERDDDGAARPQCSEIVELSTAGKRPQQAKRRSAEEAVQTLNTLSSVAHISGMGLKVVPVIAAFSSLRAVNLSGNFIVQISPGSLPKGLHSLDLSRNKIASIEGLRELTRLRVLSLSYNRISRIGHGLSSCTAIRELYLAGNKISDVEGLHRLLKLAVLDVSFNRITTARSLGQLVANYASLRALNLLGNPVQANVGDDTLRKAVAGLLPRLQYLSRQPVRPQRAREAAKDSVAQAALGNGGGGWGSRRQLARRLSQSPGSSAAKSRGREREGSGGRRSRPQSSSLARR